MTWHNSLWKNSIGTSLSDNSVEWEKCHYWKWISSDNYMAIKRGCVIKPNIFFLLILLSFGCGYRDDKYRFPTAFLAAYCLMLFFHKTIWYDAVFYSIISRNTKYIIIHRMDETFVLSSATMYHPRSNIYFIFHYIEIERNEQPLFCGCGFFRMSVFRGNIAFLQLVST